MPGPSKLSKSDKAFFVDDGEKRGPMTVKRVRFHPSKPKLYAQVVDRRIAVWDLNAEAEKVNKQKEKYVVGQLAAAHELGWVRGFDFHPYGELLVTAGSDRRLRLWQLKDGVPDENPITDVQGHDGWCEAAAFSPDGTRIATCGGSDFVVRIWEAEKLKLIKTIPGHAGHVRDVIWTRDGKNVISGSEDGSVHVIDAKSFAVESRIEFGDRNEQQGQNPKLTGAYRLSLSHDGRFLAAAGGVRLGLFNISTGEAVAEEQRVSAQCAFHHGTDCLAAGESEVKVWRYEPDKLTPPKPDKNGKPGRLAGVSGKIIGSIKRGEYSQGLAYSPDGKQLAVGKSNGTVELWNLV